jgi:hypothetical protein
MNEILKMNVCERWISKNHTLARVTRDISSTQRAVTKRASSMQTRKPAASNHAVSGVYSQDFTNISAMKRSIRIERTSISDGANVKSHNTCLLICPTPNSKNVGMAAVKTYIIKNRPQRGSLRTFVAAAVTAHQKAIMTVRTIIIE